MRSLTCALLCMQASTPCACIVQRAHRGGAEEEGKIGEARGLEEAAGLGAFKTAGVQSACATASNRAYTTQCKLFRTQQAGGQSLVRPWSLLVAVFGIY